LFRALEVSPSGERPGLIRGLDHPCCGSLVVQIQSGAESDLFLPANLAWVILVENDTNCVNVGVSLHLDEIGQ
jgi:hypothetical protein